jgi:hypothetical protein
MKHIKDVKTMDKTYYKTPMKTGMVKNIININKMKNQLPPQIIENKTDNHI